MYLSSTTTEILISEVVILWMAYQRGTAYEWAEHVPMARGWLRQLESDDFHRFTDGRLTEKGENMWRLARAHPERFVHVTTFAPAPPPPPR